MEIPVGTKGTVTYEIYHNLKDKWINEYPLTGEWYITVSPTANSSGDHTLEYLKKIFSPEVGGEDGTLKEPIGLVLHAFQGHFDKKVKAHNANHPLLNWIMMDGGIQGLYWLA